MIYIYHYEAFLWKSDFRLLFNREAIEIRTDAYCQNCLSDKDITLKTTQPFFKGYYDLHLPFLWKSDFRLLFNREAIEIRTNAYFPELPLWQRHYAKTTQSFFKSCYDLHLTLSSFFLGRQVLGCFSMEKP